MMVTSNMKFDVTDFSDFVNCLSAVLSDDFSNMGSGLNHHGPQLAFPLVTVSLLPNT
jgi:hypothetical protein